MRKVFALMVLMVALAGCSTNGIPAGAVLWCGQFDYTGRWLNTESSGVAIGTSNPEIAARITIQEATELALAMGCSNG